MNDRLTSFPTLTQLQDFVECGRVCRCLRNNPDISNGEIARQTRLTVERVASLRIYLEIELGLPKQVQENPSASSKVKNEAIDNILDGEQTDYPVRIDMEYTSRISSMNQTGAGVALINGFPCHVPGALSGELVKFRIRKIEPVGCEAELVRVLQKNPIVVMSTAEENVEIEDREEKTELGKECIECHFPVATEDFATYDGLCKRCWYKRLHSEASRTERRSGTFGADRAGTW